MRVIHVVHGKANPAGHNGISRVVYHLNKQEKLLGVQSEIWALVDDTRTPHTHQRDEFVSVECFPRVRTPWGRHPIIDRLAAEKDSIDLVHFHLIWFYDKNIICRALRAAGVPFIITTHGTYSKHHAYTGRRLLAKWLFELDYLQQATEIHTITREEGTGLHAYGYRGRSFVAYNGIELSEVPAQRRTNFFADKPYASRTRFIWVGVLRDDKNLEGLIDAVAMLSPGRRSGLAFVIVGPDYKGNAQRYRERALQLECADCFDFIGPLYGQDKYDAIESADVFVLPSFSEVFSLAMLDALACGKPCLVSSGCGYNHFMQDDFCVLCEPYPQDLALGIEEIVRRRTDWPAMGQRGRRAVEDRFNWPSIARVMVDNYGRICGTSA